MEKVFFVSLVMNIMSRVLLSNSVLAESHPPFRAMGLKVNVTDIEKAVDFYSNKLGFSVKVRLSGEVLLESGENQFIILNLVGNLLQELPNETRAGFSLQVNDLDISIKQLKERGIEISGNKRKEGVGYAITIVDPFGNRISMMHQTIVQSPPFVEPKVYNYGFLISDMNKARDFYADIFGFVVRSEKYLPNDLPLGHADKTFAFMLHFREGIEPVQHNSSHSEHTVILFETENIEEAVAYLTGRGVRILQRSPQKSVMGKYVSFQDPFGYVSELVERKK